MFEITSQLRLNHQKMYTPPDSVKIYEINKAWELLEREEHDCELALREELIRQQHLEQLAARFERKARLRETWLIENCKLLSVDNFGDDLFSVEASVKKHEAIETDIRVSAWVCFIFALNYRNLYRQFDPKLRNILTYLHAYL